MNYANTLNQKKPKRVLLIYSHQTLCCFSSEWPVTDCLSLPEELEKEWIEERAVRKTRFNRGGNRGNGFNKAVTL